MGLLRNFRGKIIFAYQKETESQHTALGTSEEETLSGPFWKWDTLGPFGIFIMGKHALFGNVWALKELCNSQVLSGA